MTDFPKNTETFDRLPPDQRCCVLALAEARASQVQEALQRGAHSFALDPAARKAIVQAEQELLARYYGGALSAQGLAEMRRSESYTALIPEEKRPAWREHQKYLAVNERDRNLLYPTLAASLPALSIATDYRIQRGLGLIPPMSGASQCVLSR